METIQARTLVKKSHRYEISHHDVGWIAPNIPMQMRCGGGNLSQAAGDSVHFHLLEDIVLSRVREVI